MNEDDDSTPLPRLRTRAATTEAKRQQGHLQHPYASNGAARRRARTDQPTTRFQQMMQMLSQQQQQHQTGRQFDTQSHDEQHGMQSLQHSPFQEQIGQVGAWFEHLGMEEQQSLLQALIMRSQVPLAVVPAPPVIERLDFLEKLPTELCSRILMFLCDDVPALCACAMVSRRWRSYVMDPKLWQRLCFIKGWVTPVERALQNGDPALAVAGRQYQAMSPPASSPSNIRTIEEAYDMNWLGTSSRDGQPEMRPMTVRPAVVDWRDRFKRCWTEETRLHNNWVHGMFQKHHVSSIHADQITCLKFSGDRLVTGSSDCTLKVWDLSRNVCLGSLDGHTDAITSVDFNDQVIVTASMDTTLRIYDAPTGECLRIMQGHLREVECVTLWGDRVVSGSWDNMVRLWSLETGECYRIIRGHTGSVYCVQVDDTKIVTGSGDRTVRLWQWNGECIRVIEGHRDTVTCLHYVNNTLFTGSFDHDCGIFDLNTGRTLALLKGHGGEVWAVQSNGKFLISASMDGTFRLWDLAKTTTWGTCLQVVPNGSPIICLQFDYAKVICGSTDGSLSIFDFSI